MSRNNSSQSAINYGIRIKLQLGFIAVLVLTIIVGCVGYYGMEKINQSAEDVGGHWLKATGSLGQVIQDTEDSRRALLAAYLTRTDELAYQGNKEDFMNYKAKWDTDFTSYETYVTSSEGKTRTEAIRKSFSTYLEDCDRIWNLLGEGKDAEATPIITDQSNVSFELVLKNMEEEMAFQGNGGAQAVIDAETAHNNGARLLLIFIAISVVGGGVLAFMLARHISKPLAAVTKVAQAVAEGDLNVEMPVIKNRDEIGVLAGAVAEMVNSLREVIGEVLTQSVNVAATSQELSAAAEEATASSAQVSETLNQLAAGATEQAISVGDTSSVLEQLAANSQQVAENAEIVSLSSGKASKAAEIGAVQAENAVQKIEQIRDVSVQTAEAVF